ncbi:hypothetical protein BN7_91 [Wickerhamomyces ciferrii]|uniref:Protein RMD9, mitochondrial n=1 Tax=Wickerhamomyces ciferrii (strain ATCC 14091 / BCRC 22168 / CBS 111 / JCM 3599 / NBRC 0793 / NRRL Y-1031 F-60-10) TaxID=1206466 RepID=K0KHB2_WICCF|nr:uncharacterized protein BN7_91 [Wickerhamomyces ciferrii]CCH40558.1 hypothetical protein BN7_91 [Wickerhamomyces ciferrii]
MFRITQSNVLKTRIANQVVSNARNSLNHSIRFNSIALERSTSQEINNNTNNNNNNNNFSFTKTIKDVAALKNQDQSSIDSNKPYNKKSNSKKNSYQRNNQGNDPKSPWFNQLNAFDDVVNQTASFNTKGGQAFIWENAQTGFTLYKELKGTPDFKAHHLSKLIHLLHNGLRANRFQLTRLAKKPDYDSRSFLKDMETYVKNCLREITNDILDGTSRINDTGAMHLLTSLKELHLSQEAIGVWSSCVQVESVRDVFLNPKVVGVLLPLMYEAGSSFQDVKSLFDQSLKLTSNLHPNLSIGMIRTCLAANENDLALELFSTLCDDVNKSNLPYIIEAHLSFIGDCQNPIVANSFFNKAINKEMPYHLTLQVSAVKTYLENLYNSNPSTFDNVLNDWTAATKFYGRNIHHGISSSLNNTFFDLFFQHYSQDPSNGLLKLKEIISIYNDIKPIDEPFFNIIISKIGIWKTKSTIDSLYQAYDIYNIKKSQVSRRIYLKSLGSVKVSESEILESWYDLLKFSDLEGSSYIANADWAAIRDATANSQIESRPLLFAQVFKKYGEFCRDLTQYSRLKSNSQNGVITSKLFKDLDNIDDSNVELIQFNSIRSSNY